MHVGMFINIVPVQKNAEAFVRAMFQNVLIFQLAALSHISSSMPTAVDVSLSKSLSQLDFLCSPLQMLSLRLPYPS